MRKLSLKSVDIIDKENFINLISNYAVDTEGLEVYKALAYTVGVDRDGEIAEKSFIDELAVLLVGKPVIKNHDWQNVDGAVGTIIKTEVIDEDLIVYFYVADTDTKDKLNKGLYKGVSCGFEPVCEVRDDTTYLVGCKDAFEMSLVNVPAVPKASIKIKSFSMKGEEAMPFRIFRKQKLVAKYPSLKNLEPEVLDELAGDEVEITEADIESLLNENTDLKTKLAELEAQIEQYKNDAIKSKNNDVLVKETTKAVEELKPTEEAKEVILDEAKEAFEKGELVIEHCDDAEVVKGLDKFIDKVKIKYTKLGLLNKEIVVENKQTVREVKTKDLSFSPIKNSLTEKHTKQTVKKSF